MEVSISGRNFLVSDSLQERITKRVRKLLRFWERVASIHVTLGKEGVMHTVEILLSAEHKHDFVARAAHENLLAALDLAVEKLERQLAKYKARILARRKGPRAAGPEAAEPPEASSPEPDRDR